MSVGPSVRRSVRQSVRRLPLCSGVSLSDSGWLWTALCDSWWLLSDSEWLRVALGNSRWVWGRIYWSTLGLVPSALGQKNRFPLPFHSIFHLGLMKSACLYLNPFRKESLALTYFPEIQSEIATNSFVNFEPFSTLPTSIFKHHIWEVISFQFSIQWRNLQVSIMICLEMGGATILQSKLLKSEWSSVEGSQFFLALNSDLWVKKWKLIIFHM